jgi:hypothetical protein
VNERVSVSDKEILLGMLATKEKGNVTAGVPFFLFPYRRDKYLKYQQSSRIINLPY